MSGLARVLRQHVWNEATRVCGCGWTGRGFRSDLKVVHQHALEHIPDVLRDHLAAVAADEQVRERVALAVHTTHCPARGAVGCAPEVTDQRAADAAVAAFLAATEEGL